MATYHYDHDSDHRSYYVAATALLFIILIPALILTLLSLLRVRKHGDPSRSFVTWLKPGPAIFTIGLALLAASYLILTLAYYGHEISDIKVQGRISIIGDFLTSLGTICALLAVFHLGNSLTGDHSGYKLVAYGLAGVLLILQIVHFAIAEYVYEKFPNVATYTVQTTDDVTRVYPKLTVSNNALQFAFYIVAMALTVEIVAMCGYGLSNGNKGAPIIAFVSATLLLISNTYGVAITAKYEPLNKAALHNERFQEPIPLWTVPVNIVLSVHVVFAVFCALVGYGVGSRPRMTKGAMY